MKVIKMRFFFLQEETLAWDGRSSKGPGGRQPCLLVLSTWWGGGRKCEGDGKKHPWGGKRASVQSRCMKAGHREQRSWESLQWQRGEEAGEGQGLDQGWEVQSVIVNTNRR